MKKLKILVLIIFCVSYVQSQNKNLKSSDYDKFYPQYFFAIENAAEGDFNEALPAFEKMLNKFPGHQDAFLLKQICMDAIERRISANAAEFFFEGMNARYNSASTEEVLVIFNQAFKDEESYLPFLLLRGSFFASLNNYDRALSDFSVAIQLEPQQAICYYNRGKLYYDFKYNVQALSDFSKTIELNPNYSSAYVKRAYIYNSMSLPDRSLRDFKSANAIDSISIKSLENCSLLNNIATFYMEENNLNKALEALNLAIISDKRWYETYLNRGIVYKLQNKFDLALNDLNKAIELKPQIGKSYYNRGLLFKENGEYIKSKQDLIHAISFKDTEPRVYFILAEVAKKLNNYVEATEYYKKSIQYEPEYVWAYYQLASLYDKRRGFKEAVKYYDEFINRASNDYFEHKIKAKDRGDRIKKYLNQQKKK